jgi:hypothetical protein
MYLDLDSGMVKSCHHAVFDEAWYLQATRPPAAQLLYDLGLEAETESMTVDGPLHPTPIGIVSPISVTWPPMPPVITQHHKPFPTPPMCLMTPLPLRITETPSPNIIAARAARVRSKNNTKSKKQIAAYAVSEYLIGIDDMAMVYVSPDPFSSAFKEDLDLRKFNLSHHRMAGLCFFEKDGQLFLASMAPSTPGA